MATHADADHIEGLNDVVRNFKVRAALVARTLRMIEFAAFAVSARQMGVPLRLVGVGDSLCFGAVRIAVLWPPPADSSQGSIFERRFPRAAN